MAGGSYGAFSADHRRHLSRRLRASSSPTSSPATPPGWWQTERQSAGGRLDRPPARTRSPSFSQYVSYVRRLVHGNLGTSFALEGRSVAKIKGALPITAVLALGGVLWEVIVGIPVGHRRLPPHGILDRHDLRPPVGFPSHPSGWA